MRLILLTGFALLILVDSGPACAADAPPAFSPAMENQLGLTFSPDGQTAFWVAWNGRWGASSTGRKAIYFSKRTGNTWSEPSAMAFSGDYSDDDPFVSPDGQWLYFVSDRPTAQGDTELEANIWRYQLSAPHALHHLPINSDAAEYSPVVTASGMLYFASSRAGGHGQGDLYRALPSKDGFLEPEPLPPAMNSPAGEWNIWVSNDDREIIFEASSRSTNVSVPGDLYYSWQSTAGWTAAIAITPLNTAGSDLMPRLHPDGDTLYYTRAAMGEHAHIRKMRWRSLRAQLRKQYAPTLLVANRSSHEVTFVDLSRGYVTDRIATGKGPHLLSNVHNGRVVATGYGVFPKPHVQPISKRPPFEESLNARLTLIDLTDRSVALDTVLDDCQRPHASWLLDRSAFVTCEDERAVLEINLEDGAVLNRYDTQAKGSHVLSFDTATRTLISSNTDSGSVTLLSMDSGESRVVALAAGSEGALATQGRLFAGNATDGSISVLDLRTAKEVARIDSACGFPIGFSRGYQGDIWIACFASAELISVDTEHLTIRQRFSLPHQPLNVLAHPSRPLAYVSLPRQNAIAEVDLDTGALVRQIEVGIEPDGLRWAMP